MKFIDLGTKALRTIGAVGQGVPVSSSDLRVAFEACNDMIDAWAAKRITIFQTLRKVFDLVPGQGGPTNPYTVGLGGDFNIQRPTFISNANLIVDTTTPSFEYPLAILTPDEYARTAIKDMASAMATTLYFDGKFETSGVDKGLGDIFLYPVPNGQMPCRLALYLPYPMTGFADMGETEYTFPFGYAEALRYQLAHRLASEFGKSLSPETATLVTETFAVIQRANVPIPTLRPDWGLPGGTGANFLYNWRTGQTGRQGNW